MEDPSCFYSSLQELLKAIGPQEFKAQSGGSSTQPHLQCGGDRAELLHYCPIFFYIIIPVYYMVAKFLPIQPMYS